MYYKNENIVISFEDLLYIDTTPHNNKVDVVLGYKDQRKLQMVLSPEQVADINQQFTDYLEFKKNVVPNVININEEQLNRLIGMQLEQAIINQTQMYSKHIDEIIRVGIQSHLMELKNNHSKVNDEIVKTNNLLKLHQTQLDSVARTLASIIIVD